MAAVGAAIGASMIPVLLKPMIDMAATVVKNGRDFVFDIEQEIQELKETMEVIVGILPEAEEMQDGDVQIHIWLRKLVDIGYEARDVLDELVTVSASRSAKRTTTSVKYNSLPFYLLHRIVGCGSSSVPVVLSLPLQRRLSNKIKNVRKKIDGLEKPTKIAEQFKSMGGGRRSIPIRSRPETSPFVNKQREIVGRSDEKEGIMEKLLNHKDSCVQLVPIWGMGGLGKTTLAQYVYNDKRVTAEQYPIKNRKWCCVGEKKFIAKEIISTIIDEQVDDAKQIAFYQTKLIEKFRGDRFLIVLDDIWDIDSEEWKLLWNPLTNVGKGGVIIITTRRTEVITKIGTQVPEDLKHLSDEDCWKIFESHAFMDINSCSDLELKKSIGKQIVEKLKGHPLATEVVGRSLLNEPHVQKWSDFLKDHEWKVITTEDDVKSVLRWSYNCLSPHLKQCFTYCSLFPKDHIFDKKMLVHMWMAHGFIQNVEGGGEKRRPEDIGAQYFKDLVHASLFQRLHENSYRNYVMHDMIHDLAVCVSNEEFVRTNGLPLTVGQLEKVRHIYIDPIHFWKDLTLCKSKRSTLKRLLTMYTQFDQDSSFTSYMSESYMSHITFSFSKKVIQDIFKQFKSIRVLVLFSEKITFIPECIGELIHLRYLDIFYTFVSKIPESLCDLHNLQTLVAPVDYPNSSYDPFILDTFASRMPDGLRTDGLVLDDGHPIVTDLPKNIVNMVNLRHLRAHLPTCNGVKNLTSLQELFSISICKGDKISELGNMRQLRGDLSIKCLENVTSWEDAAQAMMQDKTYINYLELKYTRGLGDADVQTRVLDALQCPPNLLHLSIHGYNGLTSPSWMIDGQLIRKLEGLYLSYCKQLELLPPLGQLECLERLQINHMDAIKKLGEEFYWKEINEKVFFPSLVNLRLKCMENLKEWDDIVIEDTSVMFFPKLKWLNFSHCPKLVSPLPRVEINTPNMSIKNPLRNVANVMRSLQSLRISYCDGLVVLELDILVSLKDLEIQDCSNLTRITSTVNVAAAIETLVINRCQKLQEVGFESFSSLKTLAVSCCSELISFPRLVAIEELDVHECEKLRSVSISDRGLNSLQRLKVIKCPVLEILFEDAPTSSSASSSSSSSSSALQLLRLQFLTLDKILVFCKILDHDLVSLRQMNIVRFPKVKSFNEIVKNTWHKLTLLEIMVISWCDDLESLPPDIHKLSSLKKLWINGCPKLRALPSDGLPSSLEVLVISECPLLYERCQMDSGPDWHKIKHVREREIAETISHDKLEELARRLEFWQLTRSFDW